MEMRSERPGTTALPDTGRSKRPRAEDSGGCICSTCEEEVATMPVVSCTFVNTVSVLN